MDQAQQDTLALIERRWQQANRHQDLMDWHELSGLLIQRSTYHGEIAMFASDFAFASGLLMLAGIASERSAEFLPAERMAA